MNDETNTLIDGRRFYHEEEMYRRIKKAYDTGYSGGTVDTIQNVIDILHRAMQEISDLENDLEQS